MYFHSVCVANKNWIAKTLCGTSFSSCYQNDEEWSGTAERGHLIIYITGTRHYNEIRPAADLSGCCIRGHSTYIVVGRFDLFILIIPSNASSFNVSGLMLCR